jgi:hypothetical protein
MYPPLLPAAPESREAGRRRAPLRRWSSKYPPLRPAAPESREAGRRRAPLRRWLFPVVKTMGTTNVRFFRFLQKCGSLCQMIISCRIRNTA